MEGTQRELKTVLEIGFQHRWYASYLAWGVQPRRASDSVLLILTTIWQLGKLDSYNPCGSPNYVESTVAVHRMSCYAHSFN